MNFIAYLGFGLVLWVGGKHVLAGAMTKGELVSFVLYLRLFYDPISKLHGLNQMLQSARSSAERVFDIEEQIGIAKLAFAVAGVQAYFTAALAFLTEQHDI